MLERADWPKWGRRGSLGRPLRLLGRLVAATSHEPQAASRQLGAASWSRSSMMAAAAIIIITMMIIIIITLTRSVIVMVIRL